MKNHYFNEDHVEINNIIKVTIFIPINNFIGTDCKIISTYLFLHIEDRG